MHGILVKGVTNVGQQTGGFRGNGMRVNMRWLRDLEQSLRRGQVERVSMEDMGRLSLGGTGQMLRDSTWRTVKGVWEAKAQEYSKLGVSCDV